MHSYNNIITTRIIRCSVSFKTQSYLVIAFKYQLKLLQTKLVAAFHGKRIPIFL